jgi:hypothetical protein
MRQRSRLPPMKNNQLITLTAPRGRRQMHQREARPPRPQSSCSPTQRDRGDPRATGMDNFQDDSATQPEVHFNGPASSDMNTLVSVRDERVRIRGCRVDIRCVYT